MMAVDPLVADFQAENHRLRQEREDYRQAISLLLGALDARQLFPLDEAVRFGWEVMERYCAAGRIADLRKFLGLD